MVIKARSRWEIILDTLRGITEEGGGVVKKTRIMQKAYLDWRNFKKYFNFLLEHGFIEEVEKNAGRTNSEYQLTEKGKEILEKLVEIERLLR
ncbi:MAG: winged helix-turn-helix domain-containing protein [Halobacteriota archaeon]